MTREEIHAQQMKLLLAALIRPLRDVYPKRPR